MEIYKKIITIILVYAYLILSYFKILGLNKLLLLYATIGIIYTIYEGWNSKENKNSFNFLWKNNKKSFFCNCIIVLSFIIAILLY